MADIFVSYTSSDRDWAFWIAQELRELGHVPHIHEWEIRGGDNIYAWMESRHDTADHVLCVLSDEYLKAPYSTLERNAAQWQAASKRPGFVLFVAVKRCRLPTLADHIRRCELFGVPEEAARTRFRSFMEQPQPPMATAFPGRVFAVSNVPVRVPTLFLGRDEALAAVETALRRYEGRVAITALHGLRGVGKSTLAAAYAERHRSDYRATWWIRAQTEQGLRTDLAALGIRLGWTGPDAEEEHALAMTLERLRHEGEGILLIFDNVVDPGILRPYLPRAGSAHVLLTSNNPAWRGLAEPVELRLWPNEIGADYLIARTGRDDERASAEALSQVLGGLPLAHEQAAAYCERLGLPLSDYLVRFDKAPVRMLDTARDAPAEYHDGLTVAKTFALAIEEAAKLHAGAEPLMMHLAVLAPEPIPLFLFSEAREQFGEPLSSALADDGLDEAVAALRAFALIDRETIPDERDPAIKTQCIRLHRLVREVAASRCEGSQRERIMRTFVDTIARYFRDEGSNDPSSWPRLRRLDALALALINGDADLKRDAEGNVASLLDSLGCFRRFVFADHKQAHLLLERALAICESVLGPDHPDTALSLNNLAGRLHDEGDLTGARPLHERALAIRKRVLGPEHPDTAASLNHLAGLLCAQGDLTGAQPLYERALAIYERVLGPDHPNTAASLNHLAGLLRARGDLTGAQPLYERALATYERVLGPEHPHTATNLNNLAGLLSAQGDLTGARPLYERALAICERVLGREHPDTVICRANLVRCIELMRKGAA